MNMQQVKSHSHARTAFLPMQDMQEYDALCEKLKEMSTLGGISGLLG